jgi:hypothetical protein
VTQRAHLSHCGCSLLDYSNGPNLKKVRNGRRFDVELYREPREKGSKLTIHTSIRFLEFRRSPFT